MSKRKHVLLGFLTVSVVCLSVVLASNYNLLMAPAQKDTSAEAPATPRQSAKATLETDSSVETAGVVPARSVPDPEKSVKAFMYALYANDKLEYQKWILPEPGSDELIGPKQFNNEQLEELRRETDAVRLKQVSRFTLDGKDVDRKTHAESPVGTKTAYWTDFRGRPLDIRVVLAESGWKVDVRFWLADLKKAKGEPPKQSDPEMVARMFLFSILANKPEKLEELSASRIRGSDFTSIVNLPPADLGSILASCEEMPIVRARPNEGFLMPSEEIVRADSRPDTLVVVGIFGGVEVAFQLRRMESQWKVVPQQYFEMLRRNGAI